MSIHNKDRAEFLPILFLLVGVIFLGACTLSQPAVPVQSSIVIPTATTEDRSESQGQYDQPLANALIPEDRRVLPGELVLAADEDDIPAIFATGDLFIAAEAALQEWDPQEGIIGLEIDGEARAYPIRLLSLHEIVNDTVGRTPVAVTWCPLCYSAIVFDRRLDRELTFGVSGFLYKNNLVMYDHQSNTLWSQALGQGLKGAYRNQSLTFVPSTLTTLEAWLDIHPESRVLSAKQLHVSQDQVLDPYVGYYTSGAAGVLGREVVDDRLPVKSLVLGISLAGQDKAYPLSDIQKRIVIQDELGGIPLLISYDQNLRAARVFVRLIDELELSFAEDPRGQWVDTQSGSLWDIGFGVAREGSLAGRNLQDIVAPWIFWFAWVDLHPETEIYLGEDFDS
jgi:hypothetical protein